MSRRPPFGFGKTLLFQPRFSSRPILLNTWPYLCDVVARAAIGFGVLMSFLDYMVCRRYINSHRKRWEENNFERDMRDPLLQEEGRLHDNDKKKSKSNASVRDLLCLIIPDSWLVSIAFVFLVAAAICQV